MVDTILVTGSNGQLGRSLRALAEKDQKNQWVFCSRQDLDITNREKIEQIFVEHQPTHCINCAAFTNVRLAEKEPDNARRINVDGVDNLIEACNNFDTTLVHLSTDYVFDVIKRANAPLSNIQPAHIQQIFRVSGAELIVASNLSRAAYDHQLNYTFYYRNRLKKGVILNPKIQVLIDQFSQLIATQLGDELLPLESDYQADFNNELLGAAIEKANP